MIIVPVSFSVDGSKLLIHLKTLLEHPDNMLAIHPRYDILELISCLIFVGIKGAVRSAKCEKT